MSKLKDYLNAIDNLELAQKSLGNTGSDFFMVNPQMNGFFTLVARRNQSYLAVRYEELVDLRDIINRIIEEEP